MCVSMVSKSWVSIRLSPAAMLRNRNTTRRGVCVLLQAGAGRPSDARRAPPQMGCGCARLQAQEGLNCA
jgi:hypothetical protein